MKKNNLFLQGDVSQSSQVSRRSFLKYTGNLLFFIFVATPFYSFFLERFWIEVTRLPLTFKRLPYAFSGLKVVQISDLHLGFHYGQKHLQQVVKMVNKLQPDIICYTGDLIDDGTDILKKAKPILQQLKAPLGKVAIFGNHDYREGLENEVAKCFKESGFTFLRNSSFSIEKGGSRLYIAGVDDLFGGYPDIKKALRNVPKDQFTLLLAHEPDLADTFSKYPIDLQLSGHSHGGQIRLPISGAVYRPDGAKKYIEGLKEIPDSLMKLYVNRGIGTTFLPVRFNCRPEITLFTLNS